MIKINLATRKTSSLAGDPKAGKGGGFGKDIKLDGLKDLPIRKVALPLLVGFIASYLLDSYKEEELAAINQQADTLRTEQTKLKNEVEKTKDLNALQKVLEADENLIRTKLETIEKLIADRAAGPKILMALAQSIPPDVWLNEFKIDKKGVIFKGNSLGFQQISDFMRALGESASFKDLVLKSTQQAKDDFGVEVATFELMAQRR